MFTRTLHTTAVLGAVLAAAVIGLTASAPASAATRISFSALVPAPPIYTIDKTASVGTCPDPDSNARITDAYPTQWLKTVAAQTGQSSVQVLLDLDSRGNLLRASIVNSSGNPLLDQQALIAARGSKYAPEVRNCNSFRQSYFLNISFDNTMAGMPGFGGDGRHPIK